MTGSLKDRTAWTGVRRVSGLVSFEPDTVEVHLDGARLRLEPGQTASGAPCWSARSHVRRPSPPLSLVYAITLPL
jgi:hypothetical protein